MLLNIQNNLGTLSYALDIRIRLTSIDGSHAASIHRVVRDPAIPPLLRRRAIRRSDRSASIFPERRNRGVATPIAVLRWAPRAAM